ncbi:MAG: hypothetical protein RIT27_828 [Pseudomonadota bacterium]|jgi:hypothetical protein
MKTKHTLLSSAISSILGITLCAPTASLAATLPQISTGYGYSFALRDDGVLFQYSNAPLIQITLPSSSSVPFQPNTAILSNIESISSDNNYASGGSNIISSNGGIMCWSPTTDYNYNNMTTTPTSCFSISGEKPKQVVNISNYSNNNSYYVLTENGKVFKFDYAFGHFTAPVQISNSANEPVVKIDNQWGNISFLTQNGTNTTVWIGSTKLTPPEPISDIKGNYALAQSGNVYRMDYWNTSNPFTQISVPAIKSLPKNADYGIGIGTATNEGQLFSLENSGCLNNIGISNVIDVRGYYWQGIALTGGNGTDAGKIFSYQCNWNGSSYNYNVSEIPNLSNVKEIKGNSWRFNALTKSGEVFYVENNNVMQVGGISDATLISDPSAGHSLIMKKDGTVCGWGNNDRNQLSSFATSGYIDISNPVCGIEDLIVNTSTTSCIAEYKPQEPRTVSIKAIDLPILNDITGEETGKYLTCKGDLALLRGAMDLTIKGETFSCDPVATLGNFSNARYKFADNTLHIPCVSIPTTIRLPAGILIQGPTDYFSAILQLMPTDANFGVFKVIDFQPTNP